MGLREYVPLKQGLRPVLNGVNGYYLMAPRVCSTKTRIKTNPTLALVLYGILREYVPLKQGLRQHQVRCYPFAVRAPRVCSTKTRIKTLTFGFLTSSEITPRVCSTKTRIKTVEEVGRSRILTPRVCSTKTRIKTEKREFLLTYAPPSESMFH